MQGEVTINVAFKGDRKAAATLLRGLLQDLEVEETSQKEEEIQKILLERILLADKIVVWNRGMDSQVFGIQRRLLEKCLIKFLVRI